VRTTRSPSSRASSTQRKVPGCLSLILSSAEVAAHEVSAGRRRFAGPAGEESVGLKVLLAAGLTSPARANALAVGPGLGPMAEPTSKRAVR
jgi:hypothetical protein